MLINLSTVQGRIEHELYAYVANSLPIADHLSTPPNLTPDQAHNFNNGLEYWLRIGKLSWPTFYALPRLTEDQFHNLNDSSALQNAGYSLRQILALPRFTEDQKHNMKHNRKLFQLGMRLEYVLALPKLSEIQSNNLCFGLDKLIKAGVTLETALALPQFTSTQITNLQNGLAQLVQNGTHSLEQALALSREDFEVRITKSRQQVVIAVALLTQLTRTNRRLPFLPQELIVYIAAMLGNANVNTYNETTAIAQRFAQNHHDTLYTSRFFASTRAYKLPADNTRPDLYGPGAMVVYKAK